MTTGSTGTKRRTLLQRGIALLAGGAAIAGTTRWAGAASPPPAATPSTTLTLYARSRPAAQQAADGRLMASGDLLDRPDGDVIGTFYTNCFCLTSPFGVQPSAANLEFHVLQLKNGTLFSMGSGLEAPGGRLAAIVGGTDRFAGRSGSYVQRSISGEIGADISQLSITFAG